MLTLYSPPSPITAIVIWCCSTQQPQSGYGVLAVQPSPTPPTGTAGGSHHVLSQRSEPPFPAQPFGSLLIHHLTAQGAQEGKQLQLDMGKHLFVQKD